MHAMPPRSAAAIALISLSLAAAGAQAGCAKAYTVGVSALGYSAFLHDKQWRGVVPDLVQALEVRSGCRLVLEARPRARVMLEFGRGALDIVTSSQPTPERDQIGQYLPYAYTELDLVVGAGLRQQIRSAADFMALEGPTLGLVRGIFMGAELEAWAAALQLAKRVEWAADFENLATRLNAGRIQAAIVPSAIHAKLFAEGQIQAGSYVVDLPEAEPVPIGLYLNRQTVSEADQQLLQHHLQQLVGEGQVEQIYTRYLGPALTQRLFKLRARPKP